MIEFIVGLFFGYIISGDVGEPVPSQIITYTDTTQVVKVYRSDFQGYRYYPNSLAIGWNTNDYRYWDHDQFIKPVYRKRIVVNKKPKPTENKEWVIVVVAVDVKND